MGIKAEKAVVFKETTKDSKYMGKRLRVKFLMQKAVGFDFHSLFFPLGNLEIICQSVFPSIICGTKPENRWKNVELHEIC